MCSWHVSQLHPTLALCMGIIAIGCSNVAKSTIGIFLQSTQKNHTRAVLLEK